MKKVTIKGRSIYANGELVARIVGHRPHVNDIYKGSRADFAFIHADGTREELKGYAYFEDVTNFARHKFAN